MTKLVSETYTCNAMMIELIMYLLLYRRIVNDSLRTDVCLTYPPYLISLGKIYVHQWTLSNCYYFKSIFCSLIISHSCCKV